jgi:hypothetical protein
MLTLSVWLRISIRGDKNREKLTILYYYIASQLHDREASWKMATNGE